MKAAIYISSKKTISDQMIKAITSSLEKFKIEYILINSSYLKKERAVFNGVDVFIALGGDGTIIKTAKLAAELRKPVFGINAGRLGYLSELEIEQCDEFCKLLSGDYYTEKRMMLSVKLIKDGEITYKADCLNEAIICGGIATLTDFDVTVLDEIIKYRADSLMFATPTGSTAYSMSAGGPVMDPSVNAIILTPVCPHSLTSKPLIFNQNTKATVKAFTEASQLSCLCVDGGEKIPIDSNCEIVIEKSEVSADFIKFNKKSFFRVLSDKM